MVFFYEEKNDTKLDEPDGKDGMEPNSNNSGKNNNSGGNNDEKKFVHHVFIEEGTATTCKYCPAVADILHDIYASKRYTFYYVSMVEDRSKKAYDRLHNEYNIYGFPTVYIDGGYGIVFGAKEKSVFEDKISAALSRETPNVGVFVDAEYDNDSGELLTLVSIKNNENYTYNGRLKVYLTEIISRWNNYENKPYHFSFIDYTIDEDISVDAYENTSVSAYRDISDLDPDNLMLIAVVFNSDSVKKFSDPENDPPKYSFNAFYADAANATRVVVGGNLPPAVGILSPETGKIYIRGHPVFKTLFGKTILVGKTTIEAYAEDDSGVEKVELYVDGKLVMSDDDAPYSWSLRKISLFKHFVRRHTITVKAYDEEGKTSSVSIDVITFFL